MAVDALQFDRDPDLERWARELGVTYEELLSTLNYAGPTFKDLGRANDTQRAGSNVPAA